MTEKPKETQEITLKQFIRHFTEDTKGMQEEKFCFILGAGASKSSGIPTGEEFAKKWLTKIEEDLGSPEFEQWLKNEKIDADNCASYYPLIFSKRFIKKKAGYGDLELEMLKAEPSLGYSFLAEIMAQGKHNIVITTNFDSLMEDALFIFTSNKPLIIGHSSLANFINTQSKRPQIIKVHHDLLLSPRNTETDTKEMDAALKKGLQEIFKYYTPVVIGYGGNDGGFMDILKGSLDGEIFWCYVGDELPKAEIQELVADKQGFFVPIDDFDQLMFLIGDRMGLGPLHERMEAVAQKRRTEYRRQFENMIGKVGSSDKDDPMQKALKDMIDRVGDSWWACELLARQATNSDDKEKIYQEGLGKFPKSYELMSNYAIFLSDIRKDYDEAESYYKQVLKLDPDSANNNGNYAIFLSEIRKDYDKAERYYQKALELDPEDANVNGNYAIFLSEIRKDYDKAERYYQKALELDPEDANVNGNYAAFLLKRGQLQTARKFIDKTFNYNQESKNEQLELELWFYRYACFYKDYPDSKQEVSRLLEAGTRSPGWPLEEIVEQARRMNHPEYATVAEFAERISNETP